MKRLYLVQSLLLLGGTIFAWFTVYTDFARFYDLYGDITRINNCLIPNPVTTPCFYGAFAFLGSFLWSVYISKSSAKQQIKNQKNLNLLLIGSTIFAWSNLSVEVYNFYFKSTASQVSCSGVMSPNIFVTPCFIGSMFFLTSLVLSLLILRKKNF